MTTNVPVSSKLPDIGVSIFAVQTKLANEHKAINLSQGFPDFDCDPALVEAVARAMREGHNQYAPMPGVLALREGIAAKVEQLYGAAFDPLTEVVVTSGATAGLFATLTTFVQPGDEVMLFEPCYDSYVPVIRLSGGTPVFVSLRYPDYSVNWDEVRRAVTPRTRAILVNTPHNPTGTTWSADDMKELASIVDGTGIIVIGDEVYEHIIFDGRRHESLLRYPELRDRALAGGSDEKILTWVHAHGAARTDEECHTWNRFIVKLGWRDERSAVLAQRVRDAGGFPGRIIETIVDHIEYDEGRDPVAERAWEKV